MKYLSLILATLVVANAATAQFSISTTLRSDYTWNSQTEEWSWVADDENEKTFFEINKEMTLMSHTTPKMTSNYKIKSAKKDAKRDQWEFKITSDVGNNYTMILDIRNNNVRFIGYDSNNEMYMVRHTIKKIWQE